MEQNNFFNLDNINLEKENTEVNKVLSNHIKVKVQWESVEDEIENLGDILKEVNSKGNLISSLLETSQKYRNADVNVSLLLFRNGVIQNTEDLIYYNSTNLKNKRWLVTESIRNQESSGKIFNSDYKDINFSNLNDCEQNVDKIAVIISIYANKKDMLKRNFTTFGCIKDLRVRISDYEIPNKKTYYFSNLNEDNSLSTVLLLGEFIKVDKKGNKWEFKEINKGYITDKKEVIDSGMGTRVEEKNIATIITVVNDYLKKQNK